MQKSWLLTCLINFLIAALLGLLLRFVFVFPFGINFRYLTHAHSHVAMLGWVYLMLFSFIVYYFIPKVSKAYSRLFWVTEIAVVGMMLSFPFQGYAAISISFSTLHIFCSYYFFRLVWKDQAGNDLPERTLLKASLLFMLLSTIGIWCLGPAVATVGNQSAFFNIAIQFFLHFQFNGWFLFAVLAVFFKILGQLGLKIDLKKFKWFFRLLIFATILTMALPVSWYAFHPLLLWINGLGILFQLAAAVFFIVLLAPLWPSFWPQISGLTKLMFGFSLICFALKIGMQTTSLFPEIAKLSAQVRNFVIGFIHLLMLGVVTGSLFAFLLQSRFLIPQSKLLKWGIASFLTGFLSTELLLFIQGGMFYLGIGIIPQYYLALFVFSAFLAVGILLIATSVFRNFLVKSEE
ncbi:MAG: hypothetical protein MUP24_02265 [Gillisia sp.]|nr:hypothetical protein [Gillisia sp.]